MIALFLPLMAALALTAIPATVAAEPAGGGTISALRANGAHVVELGARGGLDGYLVEPAGGDPYSLYLTPDGHAIAGLLYGPDGGLITSDQIAAARQADRMESFGRSAFDGAETPKAGDGGRQSGSPESDGGAAVHMAHASEAVAADPDAQALFGRSTAAFGFTLGEAGPPVVLFGDPACRWSRSAAVRLGRTALAGRFRLHVIPVGLLGAASARKAAAIASASDPARAWFDGAVPAASPEGARRIARNNALFDAWGGTAVPLIAWRDARGRIERRVGAIDDLDSWLRELTR